MIQLSAVHTSQKHHKKRWLARSLFTTPITRARTLVAKIKFANQIARERHTLRHLSDHQLRDIGMTRNQIGTEINRSIFDLPAARFNELDYRVGMRGPQNPRVTQAPKE